MSTADSCGSRISTRRFAIIRLAPDLDTRALDELVSERRIWSPAPRPTGNRVFPVVRLNALELTAYAGFPDDYRDQIRYLP